MADLFARWGQLTKAFHSIKISMDREAQLWSSVEIGKKSRTNLDVQRGKRKYQVSLTNHIAALNDEHALCSMVLYLSYALAESEARHRFGDSLVASGIEAWGERMLDARGKKWSDIFGGKVGIIEVSVARSALAHDLPVNQTMVNRFAGAGGTCPWALDSLIRLKFEETNVYRDRLRSLLRVSTPHSPRAVKKPKPRKKATRRASARRAKREEKQQRKKKVAAALAQRSSLST